jgi:hypothetical protein
MTEQPINQRPYRFGSREQAEDAIRFFRDVAGRRMADHAASLKRATETDNDAVRQMWLRSADRDLECAYAFLHDADRLAEEVAAKWPPSPPLLWSPR